MIKIKLSFIFVFISFVAFGQKKVSSGVEYIENYKMLAIQVMHKTKIPASITLAQALHESANGTSQLAVKANNHFGVKCSGSWKGKRFYRNGNKRNSCFRKYENVEEAYEDRSRFLTSNKQYAFLFKYKQTDYKKWAYGLRRAGYASSKSYASHLIRTIHTYDLHQYDFARIDTQMNGTGDEISYSIVFDIPKVEEKENDAVEKTSNVIKHKVKSGQSLYSISRKYKVSVEKIKKANKLKSNLIKPGKILIIPR